MLSLNTPLPGRLDVWTVPPCCTNVNVSIHATPITARPWAPPFPPLIYPVCTSLTPWSSDGTAMLARIRAMSRAILTQTTARQVPCLLKLRAWSRRLSAAIQISAGEPARLARAGAASPSFHWSMVRRIKRASFAFSQRLCTTWESGMSLSTQACPVQEQSYDSCLGSRVFLNRLISVHRHNLTSWPWQHGEDYVGKEKYSCMWKSTTPFWRDTAHSLCGKKNCAD